jgi:hypothetical protein
LSLAIGELGGPLAPATRPGRARSAAPDLGQLIELDYRSLALLRVGLGLLLLGNYAVRSLAIEAFYTDSGVLPRSALREVWPPMTWSLHALSGSGLFIAGLFAVGAACALLMILGLWTRWATVASWLLLVSINNRNPLVNDSGDPLLALMLFWSIFLPLGATASVDALRSPHPPVRGAFRHPASAAFVLQVLIVYIFTAIWKTDPVWTTHGWAVLYALEIDQLTTPLGRWLLQFPFWLIVGGAAMYAVEVLGPVLALLPVRFTWARTVAAVLFIGFHAGLILTMKIGLFPFTCIVAWLTLTPVASLAAPLRFAPIARAARALGRLGGACLRAVARACDRWPASDPHVPLPRIASPLIAGLLLYVLVWNINGLPGRGFLPPRAKTPATLLALRQSWNMFAPMPLTIDGWWVAPAQLADGAVIDLRTGGTLSYDKPADVASTYPDHRWRKYMLNLAVPELRAHTLPYAQWLVRRWEAAHPERPVRRARLVFVEESTRPPMESVRLRAFSFVELEAGRLPRRLDPGEKPSPWLPVYIAWPRVGTPPAEPTSRLDSPGPPA